MDLSIIVPLYNEEESLPELMSWIDRVLEGRNYEVVFVDDGSKDNSWAVVQDLSSQFGAKVRGIKLSRNYGKSAGLQKGFEAAKGKVVFTMDGFDLVSGWKKKRHDPITKTVPTKLYNWMTRRMSGITLHDFNCGLKCYRLEVVKSIEVQGEMHRYIPLLAKAAGYNKIGEHVVQHQARKYGVTKFGLERFTNGMLDLLTIVFMQRFARKPMHLFGLLGTLTFLISAGIFCYIGGYKLYAMNQGIEAKNITEISAFYVALAGMILGSQLFLTGFLAEMISRTDPSRKEYGVSEEI